MSNSAEDRNPSIAYVANLGIGLSVLGMIITQNLGSHKGIVWEATVGLPTALAALSVGVLVQRALSTRALIPVVTTAVLLIVSGMILGAPLVIGLPFTAAGYAIFLTLLASRISTKWIAAIYALCAALWIFLPDRSFALLTEFDNLFNTSASADSFSYRTWLMLAPIGLCFSRLLTALAPAQRSHTASAEATGEANTNKASSPSRYHFVLIAGILLGILGVVCRYLLSGSIGKAFVSTELWRNLSAPHNGHAPAFLVGPWAFLPLSAGIPDLLISTFSAIGVLSLLTILISQMPIAKTKPRKRVGFLEFVGTCAASAVFIHSIMLSLGTWWLEEHDQDVEGSSFGTFAESPYSYVEDPDTLAGEAAIVEVMKARINELATSSALTQQEKDLLIIGLPQRTLLTADQWLNPAELPAPLVEGKITQLSQLSELVQLQLREASSVEDIAQADQQLTDQINRAMSEYWEGQGDQTRAQRYQNQVDQDDPPGVFADTPSPALMQAGAGLNWIWLALDLLVVCGVLALSRVLVRTGPLEWIAKRFSFSQGKP